MIACMCYYYWRQSFDCRFTAAAPIDDSILLSSFFSAFRSTSGSQFSLHHPATLDSCRTLRDNLIFMFHGVDVRCTSPQFIHTTHSPGVNEANIIYIT